MRSLCYLLVLDTSTFPQLWSCVEVSFGVISACLPSLTPLFLLLLGKRPTRSRHSCFIFSRSRTGKTESAGFNRMAEAADGDARSQSLELAIRDLSASDDLAVRDVIGGSILVTSRLDQVTNRNSVRVLEAERLGVLSDASAWNIQRSHRLAEVRL